jgi:hypothetical protein
MRLTIPVCALTRGTPVKSSQTNFILLGLAGSLLAACGGSGSDPAQPPATVSVQPDTGTVAWNATSAIDVLANDSASRGKLTLNAVTGALHGTATVTDGKVSYAPNPGFYGNEVLTYTAKAVEGGATANGELKLAVEAVLTLNGNASDNPLTNAAITAAVGAKNFTATTDASGNFSVVLRSTTPADFVTLTAVGSGTQEKVKLTSLVGEVDTLAKGSVQGVVSMLTVPTLSVSHYSTAFAALAARATNGVLPSTALQLRDIGPKVSITELMRRATAIRLAADKGIALPAGIADTQALVNSDAAVTALYAAANTSNPLLASATLASVESEVNLGTAFTMDGLSERTVAYNNGQFSVTYRADGSGRLSGRFGEGNIKWVADGATVRLTYESPVEWIYPPGIFDIGGDPSQYRYNEYAIREHSQGMVIRHVFGESAAKWAETGTVTWLDGPDAGKPVTIDVTTRNEPYYLTDVMRVERRLPLSAAMTAPGATFFGAIFLPEPTLVNIEDSGQHRIDLPQTATDVLEFTNATQARFLISQAIVTWKLQDNWLYITHANGTTWRYGMMVENNTTGRQLWIAENEAVKASKTFNGFTQAAARMAFTPELVLRTWMYASNKDFIGSPKADGSVLNYTYNGSDNINTWEITPSGDLLMLFKLKSTGQIKRTGRYVPIKMVGTQLWFLGYDERPGATSSTFIGYLDTVIPK